MADIKQISVSASINTAQDNSSNTNIVTNISTSNVPTSTLASITPNTLTQTKNTELNVVVTNMGEESIPESTLFKRLDDTFGYSEQLIKAIAKVLADSAGTQDQVSAIVAKVLADSATISEVVSRVAQYYRTYTDATANAEQLQKTIAKVLADATTNSEVLSQLVDKTAQDTTTTSEQKVFQADKVLEDWVDATDDILGEANIDDDQYADVGKTLSDYATTSDQFDRTATFDRQFADTDTTTDLAQFAVDVSKLDTATTTEQRILAVDKTAQDQATTAEQAYLNPNKAAQETTTTSETTQFAADVNKVDQATTSETANKDIFPVAADQAVTAETFDRTVDFNRTVTDATTNAEQAQKSIESVLADTTTTSDLTTQLVDKAAQDTAVTSEQQVFQADKILEDSVDATDDVLGEANVDDDQYAQVDKTLADYATTSEQFDRTVDFNRTLLDNASLTNRNLIAYSEQFDNASWGKQGAITVTANAITAPDGELTADQIIDGGSGGSYLTKSAISYISGNTYTWSCYFKAGTATSAVILVYNTNFGAGTNNISTTFNLSSGTVTGSAAAASGIESIGDGWYRCWQSHPCAISHTTSHQLVRMNTVSGTFYAWGYQVEVGSAPTPYQPATTALPVLEQTTFAVQAVYQDTATTVETFTRAVDFNRDYADQAVNTDEVQKAFATVFAEITAITEAITQLIDKAAQENVATSEYRVFQTDKVLEDWVDATDDFDGATTTEDDQYAQVDKTLSDYATTSDLISTSAAYNRTITDTDTTADLVELTIQPAYQETVTSQEQLVKDVATSLSESKILSEVFAAATDKALSDNTNSSDTVTLVGALSKTETVSISETKTLAMQSYFATNDYVEAGYVGEYYTY